MNASAVFSVQDLVPTIRVSPFAFGHDAIGGGRLDPFEVLVWFDAVGVIDSGDLEFDGPGLPGESGVVGGPVADEQAVRHGDLVTETTVRIGRAEGVGKGGEDKPQHHDHFEKPSHHAWQT